MCKTVCTVPHGGGSIKDVTQDGNKPFCVDKYHECLIKVQTVVVVKYFGENDTSVNDLLPALNNFMSLQSTV